MRRTLCSALAVSFAYALSSCTYFHNFSKDNIHFNSFSISQSNDGIYILSDNGPKYRIDGWIYSLFLESINNDDRERLKSSQRVREALKTADTNNDKRIDIIDAFAILVSRDRSNRLIAIVNSHYPPDEPRLPLR